MNFFKFHIGDYEAATAHLSWDEDAAYNRLMRVYYRRQAPIPDATRHRLIRAITKAQKRACDRVLSEYFTLVDSLWINKRCEAEIKNYSQRVEINRNISTNRSPQRQRIVNESSTNRLPNQIPEPDTRSQNQIFKTDLDVAESPTRGREVNVKTVLKNIPEEQNQEQLERNRRVAVAVAAGELELAKEIRAGRA